jgi:hypothetical protein
MPNKMVTSLIHDVTELRIAVASIKTDIAALKKLVYLGVGVGTTASAGIIVQLVAHMVGK